MTDHTDRADTGQTPERSVPGTAGRAVVGSPGPFPACPICDKALSGRQTSACSDKCRAARSRQERARKLTARDRSIRERLRAALDLVHAAWQELGRE